MNISMVLLLVGVAKRLVKVLKSDIINISNKKEGIV